MSGTVIVEGSHQRDLHKIEALASSLLTHQAGPPKCDNLRFDAAEPDQKIPGLRAA